MHDTTTLTRAPLGADALPETVLANTILCSMTG